MINWMAYLIDPRPKEPKLSKSGKKKHLVCQKQFFYSYQMYPFDRGEVGIEAIEGTDFHEYGEVFDDEKFYDTGRGDEKYWKDRPKSVVKSEYANQYIQFQQKRKETLPKEEFMAIAKEIYIELGDIRGFIDYLAPVFTTNGDGERVLTSMSIGEIKPSRKNYAPKYLRSEMAFYYILLKRGIEENAICPFYFDVATNDYKRDENGDPIPYPYTIPKDLPITHWEAYYYNEPIEDAHWVEKIHNKKCDGDCPPEKLCMRAKLMGKEQDEIDPIVEKMEKGGRYVVWTRLFKKGEYKFMNPLCPTWCDHAVYCNPYHDGYVCKKCGTIELIRYDAVHLCTVKVDT